MTAGLSSSPSLLLLATAPRSTPVTEALALGVQGSALVQDLAAAEAALRAQPAARLILACPRPEISVAERLAQGVQPSRAVADWSAEMRGLMALLRKNRRRSTLVFDDPASGAADLATLLDLEAEIATPKAGAKPDEVLLVIARDALLRDAAAHTLAGEFEATALLPAKAEPGLDLEPDAVFAAYQDSRVRLEQPLHDQIAQMAADQEIAQQHLIRTESEAAQLRDETSLLRDQLVLGQDAEAEVALQLVQAKTAIQKAAREREEALRAEAKLKEQADSLHEESTALRAEAALLRNQLSLGSQAEAANRVSQAEAAEQRGLALRAEATLLRDQLKLGSDAEAALWQEQTRLQEAERKAAAEKLQAVGAREANLAEECALLRAQIQLEISAASASTATITGLERDIAQLRAERDHHNTRADTAHQEGQRVIAQLRQQVFNLGQELELHHTRAEEHQVERQELLAEIRELHAIRAELESYFDHAQRLQEQVSELSAHAGRLEGEVHAGQSALSERAAHAEWLAAEMQRIYKSRSYRLLTPLRKLRKRSTPTA